MFGLLKGKSNHSSSSSADKSPASGIGSLFSFVKNKLEEGITEFATAVVEATRNDDIASLSSSSFSSSRPPWEYDIPERWVGRESELRQRLLDLSKYRDVFLTEPSENSSDIYNFPLPFTLSKDHLSAAASALAQDKQLSQLRFGLVPRFVAEDKFWQNYFYHVHLVKYFEKDFSLQYQEIIPAESQGNSSSSSSNEKSSKNVVPKEEGSHSVLENGVGFEEILRELDVVEENAKLLIELIDLEGTKKEEQEQVEEEDKSLKKEMKSSVEELADSCAEMKLKMALLLGDLNQNSISNDKNERVMIRAVAVNAQLHKAIVHYTTNWMPGHPKSPQAAAAAPSSSSSSFSPNMDSLQSQHDELLHDMESEFASEDALLNFRFSEALNVEETKHKDDDDHAAESSYFDDSHFEIDDKMPWEEDEGEKHQ